MSNVVQLDPRWISKISLTGDFVFDDYLKQIDQHLSSPLICVSAVVALLGICEGGLSAEYTQDRGLLKACVRRLRLACTHMLDVIEECSSSKAPKWAVDMQLSFYASEFRSDFLELILQERETSDCVLAGSSRVLRLG